MGELETCGRCACCAWWRVRDAQWHHKWSTAVGTGTSNTLREADRADRAEYAAKQANGVAQALETALVRVETERDALRQRIAGACGCRDLGDGTGTECATHEAQRLALEQAETEAADDDMHRVRAVLRAGAIESYYVASAEDLAAVGRLLTRAEQAEAERDEARGIVAKINNSMFGSDGYFITPDCVNEIEQLKADLREAEAERDALRQLAAAAYQMAGALGAPVRWLDALHAAACHQPFAVDGLLPVVDSEAQIIPEDERERGV